MTAPPATAHRRTFETVGEPGDVRSFVTGVARSPACPASASDA
ncbi:hypothetical protein [Nonomuraea sp. NPDC050691]